MANYGSIADTPRDKLHTREMCKAATLPCTNGINRGGLRILPATAGVDRARREKAKNQTGTRS